MWHKLPLMALLSLFALSGCVIYDSASTNRGGDISDITLNINFDRRSNCFDAGVDSVRVQFDMGALDTVSVPCNRSNGIAVSYQGVLPGRYTATIDAFNRGVRVYSGVFAFAVGDATSFLFDLKPVGAGDSELITNFTFAASANSNTGGMRCDEARVSTVNVTIDNGTPIAVPCHDLASNRDAAAFSGLTPGTHTVRFDVVDRSGKTLYSSRYDEVVIRAGSNEYDVNILGVAKGGLQIQWVFDRGQSCSAAGVATVEYQLVDSSGRPVKAGAVSCATANGTNNAITLSSETGAPLDAGIYSLASFVGRNSRGNVSYQSGGTVSGLYVPAGDLQAFQVTLYAF